MKNLKVKIITGFRADQQHTVDADEAVKAYYLFLNPDKRGIFRGGLAVLGADIRSIVPDYAASMGWNATYQPTPDDWAEINQRGLTKQLKETLDKARITAASPNAVAAIQASNLKALHG